MSKQANKRVRKAIGLEVSREPLPSYAWPGGYPLYYLCADGGTLCPKCVNAEMDLVCVARRDNDAQWDVIAVQANYEDSDMVCDHCNGRIEPAYAD